MSRARPADDAAKAKSRINMRLVASAFAHRQKPRVIQGSNMIYILHKPIVTALILQKRFLAAGGKKV